MIVCSPVLEAATRSAGRVRQWNFFLKISEVRWTENNNRIGNSSYQYYIRTVLTRPQKQTFEILFTIEVATKSPFAVKNSAP